MKSHPGVNIIPINGKSPVIHESAFIAPGCTIIGDVTIGAGSSIWYNCVLRAGVSRIIIERPHKKCLITIHTARPGLVIGKKGGDIAELLGAGHGPQVDAEGALRRISLPGGMPDCLDDPLTLTLNETLSAGRYSFGLAAELPPETPVKGKSGAAWQALRSRRRISTSIKVALAQTLT